MKKILVIIIISMIFLTSLTSCIERSDKMYVRMTNVGEIIEFNAINCDDAFKPYEGIKIGNVAVEKAAMVASGKTVSEPIESTKIDKTELYVKNDALWAMVYVVYSTISNWGEAYQTEAEGVERPEPIIEHGAIAFAVKVAELLP